MKRSPGHCLCVLCYDDRYITLNGKLVVSATGGTYRSTERMIARLEKDITLTVAKRLRAELQDRGIAARLLRETDLSLSLEQRAQIANQQHAGMYIALHAGMPGPGVRVYAPALTVPAPASTGPFVPWERVQSNYLSRSQALGWRGSAGELASGDRSPSTLTRKLPVASDAPGETGQPSPAT